MASSPTFMEANSSSGQVNDRQRNSKQREQWTCEVFAAEPTVCAPRTGTARVSLHEVAVVLDHRGASPPELGTIHHGVPGWLSGLAPAFGPGMILESWGRVPRRAPGTEPASPSASLCVCLS